MPLAAELLLAALFWPAAFELAPNLSSPLATPPDLLTAVVVVVDGEGGWVKGAVDPGADAEFVDSAVASEGV